MFLSLVAEVAASDPDLAGQALRGLRAYQEADLPSPGRERPILLSKGGATLRDCGGTGAPLLLVPSLINPPTILDLPGRSLAEALTDKRRVLLLDWGPASKRADLDLGGHVRELLLPLLDEIGLVALAGYCLGGTLALLAAGWSKHVRAVVTLAAPWRFSAYEPAARKQLAALWFASRSASEALGALPMEVLQAAFWSLDPAQIVAKFARFGETDTTSDDALRFILLEDWANGGEPLPCPAARELMEDLFGRDVSGNGDWGVGGLPDIPMLHVTAANDRLVPAASAAGAPVLACPAGHVGMIAGRHSPRLLHRPLQSWLEAVERGG